MYDNDLDTGPANFSTVALRYTVMVLAMTVGITILLAAAYDVHPIMMLAERVNDIAAAASR